MYISRNLEQWNAFLATLQTAFEQGKAQDFLTLLLTPDERGFAFTNRGTVIR